MKHLRSFWKKCPLILLVAVTTLAFALSGLALQSRLPERRRADGLKTPFLTGTFLYLSGERAAPETPEDDGTKAPDAGSGAVRSDAGEPGTGGAGSTPDAESSGGADAAAPDAGSEPAGEPQPDPAAQEQPEVQLQPVVQAVEDSYFDDALFIGDSRIDDMHSFSGLDNATYFAKTGMSVYRLFSDPFIHLDGVEGDLTLEEALSQRQFGKIYLMVGINEMGTGNEERFITAYRDAIDRILALQPNAIFYVMGILSVTQDLADTDQYITLDAIRTRNADLAALADGQRIFYIDVNQVFADENGYLDKTYADGDSHLKGKYYRDWADYIRANAVVFEPTPVN